MNPRPIRAIKNNLIAFTLLGLLIVSAPVLLTSTAPAAVPTATTLAATSVTATTATINGNVNPEGLDTDAWFEYGLTTNLTIAGIPNPSFEDDTYTVYPGYASDNGGGISGWTISNPARIGLNPASGSPFANNGAIPDGNNVVFLECQTYFESAEIDTTITNLTVGRDYSFSFRSNMRSGHSNPEAWVNLASEGTVWFTTWPAVGGTNDYYLINLNFHATSTTKYVRLVNNPTNSPYDGTVLLDDFIIRPIGGNDVFWLGAGTATLSVSNQLSGLQPGTTYYYCSYAGNSSGISSGEILSFTTVGVPAVTTLAAGGITATNATLNGTVNPQGAATTAWFEYGLTTGYGSVSASIPLVATNTPLSVANLISGLSPVTTYHYRLAASNSVGTTLGTDGTFTSSVGAPDIGGAGASSNSTVVAIQYYGPASPYPSIINIAGQSGLLSKVTTTLRGLSYPKPGDLDILLVCPAGTNVMLMSDCGGDYPITNLDLTLDDASPSLLPDSTQITAGVYKPTDYGAGDIFWSPAPAGPYGWQMSKFNGSNPNGDWKLYVVGDGASGSGSLDQGWSLNIETSGGAPFASGVTATSAMLNGGVDPGGGATTAYFQYGVTTNYGSVSASTPLGATNAALSVSNLISGLTPVTTYHFRLVASNSAGSADSADLTFISGAEAPVVMTLADSGISANNAALNGTVNPNSAATTAYFEYGLTTNYGSFSATNSLAATNATLSVSNLISGLFPVTTYHYRLVAGNSGGITLGADATFTTAPAGNAPPYGLYFTNSLGGDYQTAGNWSLDFVPRPKDAANFTNDASYQVTWTGDAAAANANFDAGSGTVTEALGGYSWLLTNSYILGGSVGAGGNVTLASGTLRVTNAADTARLEVRRGTQQISDGVVEADRLLLTNTAGLLQFNGGTLITRGGTVDNGQTLAVGVSGSTPALLDVRSGTPLVINTNFNLGVNNSAAAGSRLFITNGATLAVANGSVVGFYLPSDNNLALVSGMNSVWTNGSYLYLGNVGSGNRLVVSNGAALYNTHTSIGRAQASAGNEAVITGSNSVWASSLDLNVGWTGSGNQLYIRDGGVVVSGPGFIGNGGTSDNNLAIVSDTNTLWDSSGPLFIGDGGSDNLLVVSNAATIRNVNGNIGWNASGNSNTVVVTGAGTLWTNSAGLRVGNSGSHNTLHIADGGEVDSFYAWVGLSAGSSQNLLNVGGGLLDVDHTLEVRRGTLQLDGGTVTAQSLVATNATLDGGGFITFNGGTLVTHGGTVDNGQTLIVGKAGSTPAVLDVRSGTPLTVGKGFYLGDGNTAAVGSQLFITNGGSLTASGNTYIGLFSSNNLAVISGPNSLFSSSDFQTFIGYNLSGNQLVISNGATVAAWTAQIGSGNSNVVVVTGAGSVWTNYSGIYILGSGNQVLVSDGARVANEAGYDSLGSYGGNHDNYVEVTGTNSIWDTWSFAVGESGSDNSLLVSDGGTLSDVEGHIGYVGANNQAAVTGPQSLWTSSSFLRVGYAGAGSQLVISNGGTVQAPEVYLGFGASSTNNRIVIADGNLFATTNTATGVFDIRRGTNVFNAGVIETDNLLMNTGAGVCEFNGGTLRARSATVANGLAFTVGNGSSSATYQLLGNGLHTFADGLVIANHAQLIGNGIIGGVLTVAPGGSLAPGASVGLLVLSNSPSLQGNVIMEISKNGSTLANDQIQVTGPLTYGGTLTVSNAGPTALTAGDSFQLFTASSYAGAFAATNLPALGAGLKWLTPLTNGTLAVVAAVPPAISSVTVSGTNLVFNVTGGSPGGAYDLLTSTNVALALTGWTTNSTGNFDSFGNVTITNGINLDEPKRFFTVSVP